jgi:hypothetical protein
MAHANWHELCSSSAVLCVCRQQLPYPLARSLGKPLAPPGLCPGDLPNKAIEGSLAAAWPARPCRAVPAERAFVHAMLSCLLYVSITGAPCSYGPPFCAGFLRAPPPPTSCHQRAAISHGGGVTLPEILPDTELSRTTVPAQWWLARCDTDG